VKKNIVLSLTVADCSKDCMLAECKSRSDLDYNPQLANSTPACQVLLKSIANCSSYPAKKIGTNRLTERQKYKRTTESICTDSLAFGRRTKHPKTNVCF